MYRLVRYKPDSFKRFSILNSTHYTLHIHILLTLHIQLHIALVQVMIVDILKICSKDKSLMRRSNCLFSTESLINELIG